MIQSEVLLLVRRGRIVARGRVRLRVRPLKVLHLTAASISRLLHALRQLSLIRGAPRFVVYQHVVTTVRGLRLDHTPARLPEDTFFLRGQLLTFLVFLRQNLRRLL